MKHAQPRHLSRRRVERLFSEAKSCSTAGSRMEVLSRHFLGQPYQINPLIGSAESPEVFETILALSLSSSVDEFTQWLPKIRYEGGRIDWKRRNHYYMTGWIRSNLRSEALRRLTLPGIPVVFREREPDGGSYCRTP